MEPIYAPDTHNPDQGWIVTVVYDGNSHKRSLGDERSLNEEIGWITVFPWVSTAPGRRKKLLSCSCSFRAAGT